MNEYIVHTTCGTTLAHEEEDFADGLAQLHVQLCTKRCIATVYSADEWALESRLLVMEKEMREMRMHLLGLYASLSLLSGGR